MDFKAKKININTEDLLEKSLFLIRKASGWVLVLIFLLAIGYSVYLWYVYAFNPNWGDAQKQEYINTKQRDIDFDKNKFDSVINKIKQRRSDYQKDLGNIPDIFQFK